jgi:hypothetical protein
MSTIKQTDDIIGLLRQLLKGAGGGLFGNAIFFDIAFPNPSLAKANDVFINTNTLVVYQLVTSKFGNQWFEILNIQERIDLKGDKSELDRLKWIDLTTTWTVEPVNVAYSGSDGEVIQYTYGSTIYYRFVPNPYDASLDAFYTTYSNPTLSGLITTRGNSI